MTNQNTPPKINETDKKHQEPELYITPSGTRFGLFHLTAEQQAAMGQLVKEQLEKENPEPYVGRVGPTQIMFVGPGHAGAASMFHEGLRRALKMGMGHPDPTYAKLARDVEPHTLSSEATYAESESRINQTAVMLGEFVPATEELTDTPQGAFDAFTSEVLEYTLNAAKDQLP